MNKEITDEMLAALREQVREHLTEKRYAHTLAVEAEVTELSKLFLPEEEKRLRAAALLHDITKRLNLEKQLQLCQSFGIMVNNNEAKAPKLLHAKTAAALAQREFPAFADSRVLSGIRWHTTGRAGMTLFEAIVYLADYIEPTRTFEDCVTLRRFFYERISLEAAPEEKMEVLRRTMVLSFDMTIRQLIAEGALVDRDTIDARNWFLSPAL
ncbi:MAG: bis(5'-nucleosyl)-tetraphosphatase (symmetrical) YqeK [Clostridiales bacterium]|nr:bis(5'-nucleosyl)-tetraphosphatase (symmetrical) YqeK [Clostridiales bacterium]